MLTWLKDFVDIFVTIAIPAALFISQIRCYLCNKQLYFAQVMEKHILSERKWQLNFALVLCLHWMSLLNHFMWLTSLKNYQHGENQ